MHFLLRSFLVVCELGEWQVWSNCSKPCDAGERKRIRELDHERSDDDCDDLVETSTQPCNTDPCTDGECGRNFTLQCHVNDSQVCFKGKI